MIFRSRLQVYIITPGWFFKVMARADLEQQMSEIRMSAVEITADAAETPPQANGKDGHANGAPQGELSDDRKSLSAVLVVVAVVLYPQVPSAQHKNGCCAYKECGFQAA